ncbi:helix-turn-helix domain-containing protein [Peptostreptococcus equinus]|uniref:XRE family transcriptional regulator n=1 Tax=Peptostreptococcus equinus TaxID=3003601 RepID=A0ABY7JRX2_9FIRM|nr:XRE family transcriptional regulator [Peptostreptococcus sp. CBA3647]WAW15241.1 XRE family transcriptional regulator [Peptostreptococcus sp. CBA3647]
MKTSTEVMGDRIKNKRLEMNLTQEELGNRIGVQRAAINKYESGQVENMKRTVIKNLANVFNVDPQWIMAFDIDSEITTETSTSTLYKYFPVSISAGSLENIEGISNYEEVPLSDKILGKYAGSKSIILLKVNGESMNKYIPNKSYIVVDTSKKRVSDIKSKDIVVFSQNGEYSVKRFINDEANGRFIFKPESYDDTFMPIVVDYDNSEDLKLIGKVVKYIVDVD